jgi:GDSL-like lipase/acylhydrolase family protein
MRALALVYLVALHAFCAALVMNTDFLDRARYKTIAMGFWPLSDTVYVGDSITAAAPVRGTKLAIPGMTTRDLLQLLERYDLDGRRVYLLIAVNDILRRDTGVENRLSAIARRIKGPLVWSAVMPTINRADPEELHRLNAAIREICAAKSGCTFVDTSFMSAQEFYQADGVHLSPAGYEAWLARLP